MKTTMTTLLATALSVIALASGAQENDSFQDERPHGNPGGGMRPQQPQIPLIIQALDSNQDGVIDTKEIENAAINLKSLDKNENSTIEIAELLSPLRQPNNDRPSGTYASNYPHPQGGNQRPHPPLTATNHNSNDNTCRPDPGMGGANRQGNFTLHRNYLPPIIRVLDGSHDGVIDSGEIATASEALKTLDRNEDGKIDRFEAMGPGPGMVENRPGGPGQQFGPGAPGQGFVPGQRPGGFRGPGPNRGPDGGQGFAPGAPDQGFAPGQRPGGFRGPGPNRGPNGGQGFGPESENTPPQGDAHAPMPTPPPEDN